MAEDDIRVERRLISGGAWVDAFQLISDCQEVQLLSSMHYLGL